MMYAQVVFNYRAWQAIYQAILIQVRMSVSVGGPAFNADVVSVDGVSRCLLDFQRGSRPLVLVFGSSI